MFDVATISYVADTRRLRDADRDMERLEARAGRVERGAERLGRALRGIFAGVSLAAAIREFARLEDKVSEVVTLFDRTQLGDLGFTGTSRQIQRELEVIAASSGEAAATLSQGLFDIVSAGTTDQVQALEVLRTANDLAIAGATDVSVAVSGLTSILNAYSLSADEAERVSQALFVAQKFGKTTVEELSTSIGRLAPLAESLGISLEELLAAQAGVTSVGIKQTEAVSGLRAALANVLKPTEDAVKAADALGIAFDAQALEAQGLTKFLDEIVKATGGNVEAMSALFGSVEGVNAVLALTGGGADAYKESLEALNDEVRRSELFNDALAGRNETLAISFERLKQTASGIFSAFGAGFTDSFLGGFLEEITGSEEALQQLFAAAETAGAAVGTAFKVLAEVIGAALTVIKLVGPALLAIGAANVLGSIGAATGQIIGLQRALGATNIASALMGASLKRLQGTTSLLLAPFRALSLLNPFALAVGGATLLGTLFFSLRGGADETGAALNKIPPALKNVAEEIQAAQSALDDYRSALTDVETDTDDLFKANETLARAIRDTGDASIEAARADLTATEDRLKTSQRRLTVMRLELEAQLAIAKSLQAQDDPRSLRANLRDADGNLPSELSGFAGQGEDRLRFIEAGNRLLEDRVDLIKSSVDAGQPITERERDILDFYLRRSEQLREIETLSQSIAEIDAASAASRQAAARGVLSIFGVRDNQQEGSDGRTSSEAARLIAEADKADESFAKLERRLKGIKAEQLELVKEAERFTQELDRTLEASQRVEDSTLLRAQSIEDSIKIQELEKEGTLEAKVAIEDLRLQRELEAIAIDRANKLKILSAKLDKATPAQVRAIEKEIQDLNKAYDRLTDATVEQSKAAVDGLKEVKEEANTLKDSFSNAIDGLFDGSLSFKDVGKRLLNDLRGAFLAPFRDTLKNAVTKLFSGQGGKINVQGILGPLGTGVQSIFNNLNIGGLLSKLGSGLSSIFNKVFGSSGGASGLVGGAGSIGGSIGGLASQIGSFAAPVAALAGAVSFVVDLFKKSPRLEGFFGGSGGSVDLGRVDTRSGVGTEVAEQLGQGINDILESIGASVNDALQFSVLFKPEKDFLRIKFTDSLFKDFKASEVEDALSFAIRTILSDPALSSGVSDELRGQLQNGSITSLDELQAAINEDLARIQALFNPFLDNFRDFASTLERQPQALADAASGIRAYLDALDFNQFSNLSPNQQLEQARSQFNDVFARAQAGDIDAIRGLTASADRLLGISREVNASNTDFQSDRQNVVDALSQVERITDTAAGRAQAQLAELQQINDILANGINVNNIDQIVNSLTNFGLGSTGADGTIFAANQATQDFVSEALLLLRASAAQAGISANTTDPTLTNPTIPPNFDPAFNGGLSRAELLELIALTRQTNQSLATIANNSAQTANNTAETTDGLEATIEAIIDGQTTTVINPTESPGALVTVGSVI